MLKLLCYIPANLDVKTDNWFLTPTSYIRASVKTDWSYIPVKVVFKKGTMKGPVKIQLKKDHAIFTCEIPCQKGLCHTVKIDEKRDL